MLWAIAGLGMDQAANDPMSNMNFAATRSLSEYSQIAEPRGIEFSSVFASIPAMESSTLDGGFLGIEFSSESMIANTRTGS
jgi:hypothetical protein